VSPGVHNDSVLRGSRSCRQHPRVVLLSAPPDPSAPPSRLSPPTTKTVAPSATMRALVGLLVLISCVAAADDPLAAHTRLPYAVHLALGEKDDEMVSPLDGPHVCQQLCIARLAAHPFRGRAPLLAPAALQVIGSRVGCRW
jgi:hypothetical protein